MYLYRYIYQENLYQTIKYETNNKFKENEVVFCKDAYKHSIKLPCLI